MIVFFSTCNVVTYFAELLNYIDIPVLSLHGKQKQNQRTSTFFEFMNRPDGILLCTDVAARGLDIPEVDWIIQYDPTDDPKEYIHRVGRTARGLNGKGKALLFLTPHELGFLKILENARVPLNEFDFPASKIVKIQAQLESLVEKNYTLHRAARAAYQAYVVGYAQHGLKEVFNFNNLDLLGVAKSFGFTVPPQTSVRQTAAPKKVKQGKFSDDNPYGRGQ